jgi:hypothetical protein
VLRHYSDAVVTEKLLKALESIRKNQIF